MTAHTGKAKRLKGQRFRRLVRDYIAELLPGVIAAQEGEAVDRGDLLVCDVVLECKDHVSLDLPGAWRQAQASARLMGVSHAAVAHKRYGCVDACDQWVTMDLRGLRALLVELDALRRRARGEP